MEVYGATPEIYVPPNSIYIHELQREVSKVMLIFINTLTDRSRSPYSVIIKFDKSLNCFAIKFNCKNSQSY